MTATSDGPSTGAFTLQEFGWGPHFAAQLDDRERNGVRLARVLAVHRDALEVAGPAFEGRLVPPNRSNTDDEAEATVGDWLVIEPDAPRVQRVLERRSLIARRGAGSGCRRQLIAANVDTLLIATSANQDFNIARLERYLAVAAEAEVTPVVVITKADLVTDVSPFVDAVRRLMTGLVVEALDARTPGGTRCLEPWFTPGQTVALVGSSGVGKSTLVNTLAGGIDLPTQAVRASDDRGRHTTTGRSLHRLACGAWLMDTPGMRELQVADAAAGLSEVFADIAALALRCRFRDCRHASEPGCAVAAAVAAGELDRARVRRHARLAREEARNTRSLAEARAQHRRFGRMARRAAAEKARARGEE